MKFSGLTVGVAAGIAGLVFVSLPLAPSTAAQSHKDPLTPAEVEEVRDSTDLPPARVKLYMRFVTERSAVVQQLGKEELVQHRGEKLHEAIENYTSLIDELQNNLDEYIGYETNNQRPVPDLRKILPQLQATVVTWRDTVASLAANQDYDFAKETAVEATDSLRDEIKEMIDSQNKYFAAKKLKDKQQTGQGYVIP
jgi:flavodoxin